VGEQIGGVTGKRKEKMSWGGDKEKKDGDGELHTIYGGKRYWIQGGGRKCY